VIDLAIKMVSKHLIMKFIHRTTLMMATSGRGCVKTQNLAKFRGGKTITASEIVDPRVIVKVDFPTR